jgi:hypothetical protein
LKHILNSHKFRQLKQRINLRTEIQALSYKDTKSYINHRLTQAGADRQDIFSEEAIDLIYRYSKGLPRLINTICDNAMLIGLSRKKKTIDEEIIRETYEDLMEIPTDEMVEDIPDEVQVPAVLQAAPTPMQPVAKQTVGGATDGARARPGSGRAGIRARRTGGASGSAHRPAPRAIARRTAGRTEGPQGA